MDPLHSSSTAHFAGLSHCDAPPPMDGTGRVRHRQFAPGVGQPRAQARQRWSTDAAPSQARIVDVAAPGMRRANSEKDWPELPSVGGLGFILDTHTVRAAEKILAAARSAPVPGHGDLSVVAYFQAMMDMAGGNSMWSPLKPAQQAHQFQQLQAFLARLDASPTLCQLVRLAVKEGRLPLAGDGRWTLRLAEPGGYLGDQPIYHDYFAPDNERHHLIVPPLDGPPSHGAHYLSKGGALLRMDKRASILRGIVCALTCTIPAVSLGWLNADHGIDPQCVARAGVPERGAPDYLTQRIIREVGLDIPAWLSPLPFGDDSLVTPAGQRWPEARFNDAMERAIQAAGGVQMIGAHVGLQDGYLESKFPIMRGTRR